MIILNKILQGSNTDDTLGTLTTGDSSAMSAVIGVRLVNLRGSLQQDARPGALVAFSYTATSNYTYWTNSILSTSFFLAIVWVSR